MIQPAVSPESSQWEAREAMSSLGITRLVGVAAILLFGVLGSVATPFGLLTVAAIIPLLNTALLFVLVTLAYEWMSREKA
jgi:hypothetical protein